jgi:hypothetical protein
MSGELMKAKEITGVRDGFGGKLRVQCSGWRGGGHKK